MSDKNKTIAQKTAELDAIIAWFDSGEFDLELALDKFKQAEKLTLEIEEDLKALKNEINIVKKRFDQD